MADGDPPLRERTFLFGENKALVGVITEPVAPPPDGARPAVILLNAGILHRVGPNRLHVKLARTLADAGFLSMRFDYSGVGDSRPRTDNTPFVRSALEEVRQCMDLLSASRGTQRFVLAGLCSGADNAVRAAHADPRVVGAVLLEPYSVPTPAFHVWSYRARMLSPRSWWRLLSGRSELWSAIRGRLGARRGPPAEKPAAPAAEIRDEALVPSETEFANQVRAIAERGSALCLIYSSGNPGHYHYRAFLRRALQGSPGRTRVSVLTGTDHTFTPLDTQDEVVGIVREWAKRSFAQ